MKKKRSSTKRAAALATLRKQSERDLTDLIRRRLALPIEKAHELSPCADSRRRVALVARFQFEVGSLNPGLLQGGISAIVQRLE